MSIDKDKLRDMARACGNFNWRFQQDKWTEYAIRDDHAYIANMRVGSPKHSGPCPEREAKAKFLGEMTPATVLSLLDEISALQHQIAAGKAREWDLRNQVMAARESRARVVLSNRALRPDAYRYRWLRDKSQSIHSFYLSVPGWFTGVKFTSKDVDKAIDISISPGAQP